MASHVERGVLKQPNVDMRAILTTAGSRSSMVPHLTVARHQAVSDVVDLSQSSTVRRRRRRLEESVRKRRPSSRIAGVNLRLIRDNVVVVEDLHLLRASQGRHGTLATLRHGDHFHDKGAHVASGAVDVGAVEFKTSVSTAVPRCEPCGTRSLPRFSDGSAWNPDKRLPLRHSRTASARPLMRGRCLRGPRVQTPCITPRHERRLSRSSPPVRR
ncbi:hypothetical protein HPB50_007651 [Hyalomma asiaticum]|uniref:Uncharacterized protein n=1 Tax=Hyalomma asiaticum TaxID=266040 RepID=A0ACB7RMA8_HYAAI|nr:hypothetical protein HPB50_007651 [Hyalomma asiaticum]